MTKNGATSQTIQIYFKCSPVKIFQKLLVIFGLFILTPSIIEGSKILFLIPFPGPSHFLMFKVFIKELIDRGHEVTAISAYPFKERLDNYTEILIEPQWSFGDACKCLH